MEPQPAPAACKPYDVDAALTSFAGAQCPWVLSRDEAVVRLTNLAPEAKAAAVGDMPPACVSLPCEFGGMATAVGPLVTATQRSPASEMPAGVVLGFVAEDGKLTFVDLWDEAGEAVTDEGTELGPAYSLAPFDCGGALGLFARPRTTAGASVQPVPSLSAREGVYANAGPATKADRAQCRAIPWAMP